MDYSLQLSNYSYSKENEIDYYITAEITQESADWPFTITLGDGSRYGAYVNAALEKGKTYKVYERAISSRTKAVCKLILSMSSLP